MYPKSVVGMPSHAIFSSMEPLLNSTHYISVVHLTQIAPLSDTRSKCWSKMTSVNKIDGRNQEVVTATKSAIRPFLSMLF